MPPTNQRTGSESIIDYAPTPQVANHKHHHLAPSNSKMDEDLPTSVNSEEQLEGLPPECRSDNPHRPLRHVDDRGYEYTYSLQPMLYSVGFILVVELLERFSYYGVDYTQTLYLTGVYNEDWNAGLTSVDAASFVSVCTMLAYSTPFVGAILADSVLGDYSSIVVGSIGLYMPALILIVLTTIPYLLGETFNTKLLSVALLGMWPLGTGIIKSVINVFGAKQFHPLLQSSMIEQYYVNFYMTINIGALAGITIVPIVAQHDVTIAYMLPCVLLSLAFLVFLGGSPRYVRSKPRGDLLKRQPKNANLNAGPYISLMTVFRVVLLIVPFCIAYNQMPTTFIVQGTVMRKAFGVIDAAAINALDAISVLTFGWITGNVIYPELAKRNIKMPTTYKFALGSFLAALAIAWSLLVEYWIHEAYHNAQPGQDARISVLWQAPSYILIGWGEIFAVSAAYEVAFTASAPQTKALASALNIFCVGGIPNIICIGLYQSCQSWFRNARGDTNLSHLEDYATAHVGRYFGVLFCILLFGIALNVYGPVRRFVESTEELAADLVKTPVIRKSHILGRGDEESPLLRAQQHQKYLESSKQPVLYKMNSMRAGPSLSHKEAKHPHVKMSYIPKLYGGVNSTPKTKMIAPKNKAKAPAAIQRADSER
jgi:proton-dependent oligopeptide transporter, POT family